MNPRRTFLVRSVQTLGLIGLSGRFSSADAAEAPTAAELSEKAVGFLKPRQAADGSWSGDRGEPGITALVVAALLRSKRVTPDDPTIEKALGFLGRFLGPNGGLNESGRSTYSTAVALMAYKEANKGGRHDAILKAGQEFLKGTIWDESKGKGRDSDYYGGAGYGGKNSRPDLSNTAFLIEALRDSGLPERRPRAQEGAGVRLAVPEPQGRVQRPGVGLEGRTTAGSSTPPPTAGRARRGRPRTAASAPTPAMTYAGLKSMIYAGLRPDDPRVNAASDYIAKHYSVDENPGQGQKGLFYYYQTFAKALSLVGKPTLVDSAGVSHDWRAELVAALAKRQDPKGSWVNKADSFMEGDPNLVTAYGLLALAYTRA